MSVSICASGQGTKNFDRYHEFQVFIYSILNEIISSTIVYDQDANRSRGFILVVLGAPLNFIDMLYSVFPICGYIDLYLDLFQELLKENTKTRGPWVFWVPKFLPKIGKFCVLFGKHVLKASENSAWLL